MRKPDPSADRRLLIVNADDFGRSPGINRGIIKAHEQGIVTSASLMVRWPAAAEAAAYTREHPELSVGLHVDLCEWVLREGCWHPLYEVAPLDDAAAVGKEIRKQVDMFVALTDQSPTHLDSHQHVHRQQPIVTAILLELAEELRIPVRHFASRVRYCGDFYGQTGDGMSLPHLIGVDQLTTLLRALPPGASELACHPGEGNDAGSVYGTERTMEVVALCDPRTRATIEAEGIELRSFHHLITGENDD